MWFDTNIRVSLPHKGSICFILVKCGLRDCVPVPILTCKDNQKLNPIRLDGTYRGTSALWHLHLNPRTDDQNRSGLIGPADKVYGQSSDLMKVKNNNFIRNSAEHVTIDFKMDDGCALSIIGGSLMTLIAVIFIGFDQYRSKSRSDCENRWNFRCHKLWL